MYEQASTAQELEVREAQDTLTMNQRIQAFYKQSGGPGNSEIKKVLDEHLRYGKDHGVRGHMETVEDVFRDVVRKDKSLFTLYKLWMRRQAEQEEKEEQQTEGLAELAEKVTRLEGELKAEISSLRALLAQALNLPATDPQKAGQ